MTEAALKSTCPPMKMKEIMQRIDELVRCDDKHGLATYLTRLVKELDSAIIIPLQGEIFKLICYHRAVGCARALLELEGDMGWTIIDLKDPLDNNYSPLELAVVSQSFELTELFVNHAARQGVPTTDTTVQGEGNYEFVNHAARQEVTTTTTTTTTTTVPVTVEGEEQNYVTTALRVALDALSQQEYVTGWTPDKSVFKLFCILCIPELKDSLEIIKLLASKTNELQKLCFMFVDHGKLTHLSALLLVAWDSLMGEHDNFRETPLVGYIRRPSRNFKVSYTNSCFMDILQLLAGARPEIESFRNSQEVKSLRKEDLPIKIGYQLLSLDDIPVDEDDLVCNDIPCFLPRLLPHEVSSLREALANRMLFESPVEGPVSYSPPHREMTWPLDVYRAVHEDDRNTFLALLRVARSEYDNQKDWIEQMAEGLISAILEYDSVDCARAILSGDTGGELDFGWIVGDGQTPLHYAAHVPAPRITQLFLDRGGGGERTDWSPLGLKDALPLDITLRKLCDHSAIHRWPVTNSVNDLIAELCDNDFGKYLETIRLLMLKTPNIERIFLTYLKEERTLEVCAMLMVGNEKFRSLRHSDRSASSRVCPGLFQWTPQSKSFSTINSSRAFGEYNQLGNTIHALFSIFERVGEQIAAYIRLDKKRSGSLTRVEVSWILKEAVKPDDLRASEGFDLHSRLRGMTLPLKEDPLPTYPLPTYDLRNKVKSRGLHTSAKLGSISVPAVSPLVEVRPFKRLLHSSPIMEVLRKGFRRL